MHAVLDSIKEAIAAGQQTLAPGIFAITHGVSKNVAAAAFKRAERDGIVVKLYQSMSRSWVYGPAA